MRRRVLVATDFSADADRALGVGIRLGRTLQGTVDLVHVYGVPVPTVLSVAGAVEPASPAADDLLNVYRQLEERAATVRAAGVDCAAAALGGDAALEIVAHAQKLCADMLVMGRRGLSGLRRMVLGGVTERVLRTSAVPVLVIPAPM